MASWEIKPDGQLIWDDNFFRLVGLNPAKVNPLGGAIALGHPLGATGAVRVATLVNGLRRRKQKYGMVTMCIGTGMGAAGVFEAV